MPQGVQEPFLSNLPRVRIWAEFKAAKQASGQQDPHQAFSHGRPIRPHGTLNRNPTGIHSNTTAATDATAQAHWTGPLRAPASPHRGMEASGARGRLTWKIFCTIQPWYFLSAIS